MVVGVGPAARQQEADAGLLRGAEDPVVVAGLRVDVLMVDHRRRAAADVLDEAQHGGDVRVMLGQRLRHRPDGDLQPLQQRLVIGQPAQEGLKQVGVRVDHARHDGHVRGVDDRIGALAQLEGRRTRTHGRDPIRFQEEVARRVYVSRIIDRDDGALLDQNVTQVLSSYRITEPAE